MTRLAPITLVLLLALPCSGQCNPKEIAKLTSEGGDDFNGFGGAIAQDGSTLIVGATGDFLTGHEAGSAYIFVNDGRSWAQTARLTVEGGKLYDSIAMSVAISGDTALIGAPYQSTIKGQAGAAHAFVRDAGGAWSHQIKFYDPDGETMARFGWSVAIVGDIALVGSPDADKPGIPNVGSVTVFRRTGELWKKEAKLTPDRPIANEEFGFSLAFDGVTAVVGAPGDWKIPGAAYVFTRSNGQWTLEARLQAGATSDGFGFGVALDHDNIIAGAPGDSASGLGSGAAYLCARAGGEWSVAQKILPSDSKEGDTFGFAVALSGNTAAIGALDHEWDGEVWVGAAYLFTRHAGVWSEKALFSSSDGKSRDFFGVNAAIEGDRLFIGATGDVGFTDGAVYVFDPGCAPCSPDCDGNSWLDIDDFICFQTTFALGDLAADCDQSGALDFDDFICFQTAFGLGCS